MAYIYDDDIWATLSTEGKLKWLKIEADNDALRCSRCMHYACKCGEDIDGI